MSTFGEELTSAVLNLLTHRTFSGAVPNRLCCYVLEAVETGLSVHLCWCWNHRESGKGLHDCAGTEDSNCVVRVCVLFRIGMSEPWEVIRQDLEHFVVDLLFPLLGMDPQDLQVWKHDPARYVSDMSPGNYMLFPAALRTPSSLLCSAFHPLHIIYGIHNP